MGTLAAQAQAAQDQVEVMRQTSANETAALREQIDASVALAEASKETADAAKQELEVLAAQADAAKRQSEIAESALQASVKPLVVDVPRHTMRPAPAIGGVIWEVGQPPPTTTQDVDVSRIESGIVNGRGTWLRVPVRNVGAGLARILAATVTIAREDAIGEPVIRGNAPSIIATDEHDRVLFWGSPGSQVEVHLIHLLQSNEKLVVEIAYCDLAGHQEAATSLHLSKTADDYAVTNVMPEHSRRFTAE